MLRSTTTVMAIKIWLDIQGAAGLPARSEHSFVENFGHSVLAYDKYTNSRFSPIVQVLWNGRVMGRRVRYETLAILYGMTLALSWSPQSLTNYR